MNTTFHKITRGALMWLAILIAGFGSTPIAAQAAAPVYVVDSAASASCAPVYNALTYGNPLQQAIDDAIANGVKTIQVCPGGYPAFFVSAANGLTIKAKDPSSRPWIYAPIATNGTVVAVYNSRSVVIDGLIIEGAPFVDGTFTLKIGIEYSNSSGTIQNNIIMNVRSSSIVSGWETGIQVWDSDLNGVTSNVTVKNNLVTHYGNNGISAFGAVKIIVSGNQIDGANGDTTTGMPDSGILLASNTDGRTLGSISKNLVNFNKNGIELTDVSGVSVTGNLVQNAQSSGLMISTTCAITGLSGSKNKISGNTVTDVTEAVRVIAAAENGSSNQCNAHADNNIITKNTLIAAGLSQPNAIFIGISVAGSPHIATAAGNTISGNSSYGFGIFLTTSGATGTKLSKNVFMGP